MRYLPVFLWIFIVTASGCASQQTNQPDTLGFTFPQGFNVQIFASRLEGPRLMTFSPDNRLFVALHGSWNRSSPVGYKVVRIPMRDGKPGQPQDFMTGFLKNGKRIGRPVDVIVWPNGEMYISDDYKGNVYRINYQK